MSRLVSLLIVLLAIAVATPVLAEQRLTLNGEMRVRGWYADDANVRITDFSYNEETDIFNINAKGTPDSTRTWADQRLRIGGKLSVAEGVSVTFRMDATENNWGTQPGAGSGRFVDRDTSMQWDRAHLDLVKGDFHLRAGQQYVALGQSGFDAQDNGLALTLKGAVPVTLFYMLDNDRGIKSTKTVFEDDFGDTITVTEERYRSDAHYFGFNVGHKTDAYAANLFAAGQKGGEEEVFMVGLNYATSVDAVKLFAELDYFTGDADANTDAYGLQAWVDVSMAATDVLTVGGQFFYAQGDDEDKQYHILGNDFGGWDPLFALGTNLDNEAIKFGRPFGIFGGSAGVMGARLYGNFKATDSLNLGASVTYATADEEDARMTIWDEIVAVGVGASYQLMANTKLGAQLQYINVNDPDDFDQFVKVDDIIQAGVGLFVNF